jgi:hypothetical protein
VQVTVPDASLVVTSSTMSAMSRRGTGGTEGSKLIGTLVASMGVVPFNVAAPIVQGLSAQSTSRPCTVMMRRTVSPSWTSPSPSVVVVRAVLRSQASVPASGPTVGSHWAAPKVVLGEKPEPFTVTVWRSTRSVEGSTVIFQSTGQP